MRALGNLGYQKEPLGQATETNGEWDSGDCWDYMDGAFTPFQAPFAELFLFFGCGAEIALRSQSERQFIPVCGQSERLLWCWPCPEPESRLSYEATAI